MFKYVLNAERITFLDFLGEIHAPRWMWWFIVFLLLWHG